MTVHPTHITEPVSRETRFRIEMTVSCKDCASIPKLENAGQIVTERGERVQIMHNGVRVLAGRYHGDWMAEIITRLRGHHEPQEEMIFHEVLKLLPSQATMIELGGFWSYYSLWFLHQSGAVRRAIVVEPDPHHLAIGRVNARLNDRQIEFLQASVGPENIPESDFQAETSGQIRIPQVTVAQLLDDFRIARVDLLHCDVQGAETEILRSCMRFFADGRIRFCFVSTHTHHISGDALTHQRCLALLKAAGGQILAKHDVHDSYSGDGLIVAHFGDSSLPWPPLRLSYNRYSTSLFRNPLFDLDEAKRQQHSTDRNRV
jgi:FkbM family methyltransferase